MMICEEINLAWTHIIRNSTELNLPGNDIQWQGVYDVPMKFDNTKIRIYTPPFEFANLHC